jgi:flavin-dependent dehydrogenase
MQEHSHLMRPYGCGWHVDRPAFDRMLAEAAVTAGAELRRGTELVEVEAMDSGGWRLDCRETGRPDATAPLEARVLVDASGRGARVAGRLGARRIAFDHLVGVAALAGEVDTSREGYILVEGAREGWWYSAPVPAHQLMVAFMTDADLCGRDQLSTAAGWSCSFACTTATRERANGPVEWGPRVFSAVSQRLHRADYNAPWLAVGDAALAVDPVSGSGVIRALRYARAGADAALAMLDGREGSALREYEDYLDRECAAYLDERFAYYGMEQRWPDSPFWKRRSSWVLRRPPVGS